MTLRSTVNNVFPSDGITAFDRPLIGVPDIKSGFRIVVKGSQEQFISLLTFMCDSFANDPCSIVEEHSSGSLHVFYKDQWAVSKIDNLYSHPAKSLRPREPSIRVAVNDEIKLQAVVNLLGLTDKSIHYEDTLEYSIRDIASKHHLLTPTTQKQVRRLQNQISLLLNNRGHNVPWYNIEVKDSTVKFNVDSTLHNVSLRQKKI
jgi:hypothetical protein